ncbi:uncharacterized protein LOC115665467 [Syzygium oleosum]|uniref:uncharacterized protein LOC115665467 n=1 Tax=Syzygium oleosum TaxID=219896 RepID=UPI0011D2B428|nr:uncharacterized protein LOC115665467 [Syzygium oleosum]
MASQKETFVAKWTEPLTNLLVSLMVEKVKRGNRTTTTYNKVGWNNIVTEFNKQTTLQFTVVQLKNRTNKLRRQYGSYKKLLSQSGFGWDHVNKTVIVEDPSVWDDHIKDNIEWAKFRKDGFPQYPDLCIVFGDTYATGDYAVGNAEYLVVSEGEDDGSGGDNGGGALVGDPNELSDGVFTPDVSATQVRENHKLDRTPNSKRRRKSSTYDIAGTCKAIQDMIKSKASQSTSGSITSHVPPPENPYSMGAVVAILNDMLDLEQSLYNKAMNQACLSANWREGFVLSLPERRRGLLESL